MMYFHIFDGEITKNSLKTIIFVLIFCFKHIIFVFL